MYLDFWPRAVWNRSQNWCLRTRYLCWVGGTSRWPTCRTWSSTAWTPPQGHSSRIQLSGNMNHQSESLGQYVFNFCFITDSTFQQQRNDAYLLTYWVCSSKKVSKQATLNFAFRVNEVANFRFIWPASWRKLVETRKSSFRNIKIHCLPRIRISQIFKMKILEILEYDIACHGNP